VRARLRGQRLPLRGSPPTVGARARRGNGARRGSASSPGTAIAPSTFGRVSAARGRSSWRFTTSSTATHWLSLTTSCERSAADTIRAADRAGRNACRRAAAGWRMRGQGRGGSPASRRVVTPRVSVSLPDGGRSRAKANPRTPRRVSARKTPLLRKTCGFIQKGAALKLPR
jgi:hypothetical protein